MNIMTSKCCLHHAAFLLGLLFNMFFRNVAFTLNGLHGGLFQKTELFITTALRISVPTEDKQIRTEIIHQMKQG
jgi:hypothetical protein